MVGFDAFRAPASTLEERAKRGDAEGVSASILELQALAGRVSLEARADDAESGRSDTPAAIHVAPSSGPVVSRFASNPKLRPTLAKFAQRLEAKLEEMEQGVEARDLARGGELAHWLKGAAGTVGFEAFTAPAAALEGYAREHKEADVEAAIQELRELAGRIEAPRA
jgi:HPt (histidine-containing phosphotransfer) domain-containing protein